VAEEAVLRGIPIHLERLPRTASSSIPPDSVKLVLGGVLADTIHGVGFGGAEGHYDGTWGCPAAIPPVITDNLLERGYPVRELEPGEWHLLQFYGGD
jgi:hypothetical protein